MKVALLFLSALVLASALPSLRDDEYELMFNKWAQQHNKRYASPLERTKRLAVFRANIDYIRANQANPHRTVELKMNAFGDLTNEEFVARYTGYRHVEMSYLRALNGKELHVPKHVMDSDIDWRAKDKVTPIKDQGQCGSCWAFSAVGAIESGYAIDQNTKATIEASEQQLVDCAGPEGNQGCNGGLMDYAFEYVIKNKGLCSESAYPYTARDGTCKKSCSKVLAIKSFTDVKANNASALLAAVATRPVSVAVDASGSDWQFYSGGVVSDKNCGTQLDHGVLAVGHIVSHGSTPYWIVKNSWGKSWGAQGYIYIADTRGNNQGICGINMVPSYPTGVHAASL